MKPNVDELEIALNQHSKDVSKHTKFISNLEPSKQLQNIYSVLSFLLGKRLTEMHVGPKKLFTKESLKKANIVRIFLSFQSGNNIDYNNTEEENSFQSNNYKRGSRNKSRLLFENKFTSTSCLKQNTYYYDCAIYNINVDVYFKNTLFKNIFVTYYQLITLEILVSWMRKHYEYNFDILICNWNNNALIHELFESNIKCKLVYKLMHNYKCFYVNKI